MFATAKTSSDTDEISEFLEESIQGLRVVCHDVVYLEKSTRILTGKKLMYS